LERVRTRGGVSTLEREQKRGGCLLWRGSRGWARDGLELALGLLVGRDTVRVGDTPELLALRDAAATYGEQDNQQGDVHGAAVGWCGVSGWLLVVSRGVSHSTLGVPRVSLTRLRLNCCGSFVLRPCRPTTTSRRLICLCQLSQEGSVSVGSGFRRAALERGFLLRGHKRQLLSLSLVRGVVVVVVVVWLGVLVPGSRSLWFCAYWGVLLSLG
jgi:hypothetical protein